MPQIVALEETTDERLVHYANLRWDCATDVNWFIVEGRWCVHRLIESPIKLVSILVERGKESEWIDRLDDETPIYSLPIAAIRKLVGYDFHRGILACAHRPPLKPSGAICDLPLLSGVILCALGVSDRENLGSMLRTAAAFGISQVLLGPGTADPYARRTVRVSMATVFKQEFFYLASPAADLKRIQQTGRFRTVATTLSPDAIPPDQLILDDRTPIVLMGSEASGVGPDVERHATDRVKIPMQLGTDSLNVSVAAAIFIYELTKRLQQ